MDDWKLKTSPVVILERPNERFVDSQTRNLERRIFRRTMCRLFAGAAEILYQTQLLRLRKPETKNEAVTSLLHLLDVIVGVDLH